MLSMKDESSFVDLRNIDRPKGRRGDQGVAAEKMKKKIIISLNQINSIRIAQKIDYVTANGQVKKHS